MTDDTLATNTQCDDCVRAERECPSYPSPVGHCRQHQSAFVVVDGVQRRVARQWAAANNLEPEEDDRGMPDLSQQQIEGPGDEDR